MKILMLSPGLRTSRAVQKRIDNWIWVKELLGNDVIIEGRGLTKGSINSEGDFDDYVAGSEVSKVALEIDEQDYDALVISDTGDPFLFGLREYLDIPVVGPMETSLHFASTLGYKFSIITPAKFMIPRKERQVKAYGMVDRLASIRAAVSGVAEVRKDPSKTIEAVVRESDRAIEEDGAHVIIQMCGAMVEYYNDIKKQIKVPLIDPVRTSLKYAETLVKLGLTQSKISYPKPGDKKRVF